MKLHSFRVGPVRANSYIIYNESTKEAILIDAGGNAKRILKEAEELGVTIKYVLLTHGHFDHAGAAAELQEIGAKVYVHKLDADKLFTDKNLSFIANYDFKKFHADVLLDDGDILNLCGYKILVLHTPGHTIGSVSYIVENYIFSGDTLFKESIGRTDLGDEGDFDIIINSIKTKLFNLKDNYYVYPGHEDMTTLDHEKNHNPYFKV